MQLTKKDISMAQTGLQTLDSETRKKSSRKSVRLVFGTENSSEINLPPQTADLIVIFNLRHFPAIELSHYGVKAIYPDNFIRRLIESNADLVFLPEKSAQAARRVFGHSRFKHIG